MALSPGFGDLGGHLVRIDHTGQRARIEVVLEALEALAIALEETSPLSGSLAEALSAAERAWAAVELAARS